VCRTKKRNEKG
jgi:hypothetical protein